MQRSLFSNEKSPFPPLLDYVPRRASHFEVERIVLTKGSLDTEERRLFIERIIALYPETKIEKLPDTPHNRVAPISDDPLERHKAGKRTLVFGVHNSALRKSEESGNTCPNYWHFSPYGFCPYDCKYCYLAGTRGIYLLPAIKIFVNLPEIVAQIDRQARELAEPTAFYLGKLQDALALDPLTGYSRALVPFFAGHPYARMTMLTKCADVENLLNLDHQGHTIVSWSLNPPEIHQQFEHNVSHPAKRIEAMRLCAEAGYPVRAVIMPMIPVDGWKEIYTRFIAGLLGAVPLDRLTMAGICSYPDARRLMEQKLGDGNAISRNMNPSNSRRADLRARFSPEVRVEMYKHVTALVKRIKPDLALALCLEEPKVMAAVGLAECQGRCNCVL